MVKDAQWDSHAYADILIDGRIAPGVETKGGIGRSIGNRQLIIVSGLLRSLYRGQQVRPGVQSYLTKRRQILNISRKIIETGDVELFHPRAIIQQLQQLDL